MLGKEEGKKSVSFFCCCCLFAWLFVCVLSEKRENVFLKFLSVMK